jgi:hypothetical protein
VLWALLLATLDLLLLLVVVVVVAYQGRVHGSLQ